MRPAAALASVHGVDFTSAPGARKPISIASGVLRERVLHLDALGECATFAEFERWLARPGPWIGGFDFPFGLPRAAVRDLGWPLAWPALVRHCAALGRGALRAELDAYRCRRAPGDKYPYRGGDRAAGAHSPIKLVNPPVALMFLEGAPRLLAAGLHLPGIFPGDPGRVAVEAYPGFAVRRLFASRVRLSYKSDARAKQTEAQRALRAAIVRRIAAADAPLGVRLAAARAARDRLIEDASGDRLDAVLCALQAAWAQLRRHAGYGLPPRLDPLEGWIASVPAAGACCAGAQSL